MEKINIRSPYYIKKLVLSRDYVNCELWIYTGTSVTDRGAVKYTLTNRTPNDGFSVFEISELIRDYLDVEFNGNYTSQMAWTDYRFTTGTDSGGDDTAGSIFVAESYDGYGYFHEGPQAPTSQYNENFGLFSNDVIYHYASEQLYLPFRQDDPYSVIAKKNGVQQSINNINEELDDSDRIAYLSYDTTTTPIDEIVVDTRTIQVKLIEECKYTPIKATFVNKFGALQDLWFFKNYSTSISTKGTDYKANLVNTGSYTPTKHQKASLGLNGSEKITLNSGYYPEDYNEIFKQLFLSEKIWLEIDGITFPALISGKNVKFKTQLTSKLIEYAINFDFSNEIINNIR